jgi:hypothetical protein
MAAGPEATPGPTMAGRGWSSAAAVLLLLRLTDMAGAWRPGGPDEYGLQPTKRMGNRSRSSRTRLRVERVGEVAGGDALEEGRASVTFPAAELEPRADGGRGTRVGQADAVGLLPARPRPFDDYSPGVRPAISAGDWLPHW